MNTDCLFSFKTDISNIAKQKQLNNPFALHTPELAKIAAEEFQEFIALESKNWGYNFDCEKGKMFGVLVVLTKDNELCYLGAISGKLPRNASCKALVPSVFDDSAGDYFINKGMIELTEISNKVKKESDPKKITEFKTSAKLKSHALQRRLFENYRFQNLTGDEKNVIELFKISTNSNPPAAAGECAAPKLIQYAFEQTLKPIALAEFWWGNSITNNNKEHGHFYPACKDRCRPILEFMLENTNLYANRIVDSIEL